MNDRKRATTAFIDIDALLQDTWLQVISLRHGPTFQDGEGRTLWERCIDDVGRVQRELKASELDEASCQHILTAQCALLDEAVKGRGVEDDACIQWYDIPLTQEPLPGKAYKITMPNGSVVTGITDAQGATTLNSSDLIDDMIITLTGR